MLQLIHYGRERVKNKYETTGGNNCDSGINAWVDDCELRGNYYEWE